MKIKLLSFLFRKKKIYNIMRLIIIIVIKRYDNNIIIILPSSYLIHFPLYVRRSVLCPLFRLLCIIRPRVLQFKPPANMDRYGPLWRRYICGGIVGRRWWSPAPAAAETNALYNNMYESTAGRYILILRRRRAGYGFSMP